MKLNSHHPKLGLLDHRKAKLPLPRSVSMKTAPAPKKPNLPHTPRLLFLGDNDRDDDNHQKNDDANDYAHAHLHVLPPHLLSDPIGPAAETQSRHSKIVSLILEAVQSGTTVSDLIDVLPHDSDGIVDLRLNSRSPLVSGTSRLSLTTARSTTAGDIRIVRLVRHYEFCLVSVKRIRQR